MSRFNVPRRLLFTAALATGLVVAMAASLTGCDQEPQAAATTPVTAHVVAGSQIDAGRYLIEIGGCNDCHTDGVMAGQQVPEEKWLTGMGVGFQGPWGTTYATNLRLWLQPFTADQFIQMMRSRNSRPPMPWISLHAMSDDDLRAMYAYIKHLGPAGEPAPKFLPPGEQPATPFIVMVPQMPGGGAPAQPGAH